MKLSLEQVRHVARLARLSLAEEEEERMRHQLSAILDAVEQLRELDTDKVEPTSHPLPPGERGAMRGDVRVPGLSPEQALSNAPAKVGTSFAVPKILE